jgi:DNA-directed RNA polymerase alpha subunit
MNEELEEYKNKVRQAIFQIDSLKQTVDSSLQKMDSVLQSISFLPYGDVYALGPEEPLTILEEVFVPAPIVITKDSRVDEIGLVARGAACALKRNGYLTVKDLTKVSYYDVLSTPNFGDLGMSELVRVLSSSGITLKNAPKHI